MKDITLNIFKWSTQELAMNSKNISGTQNFIYYTVSKPFYAESCCDISKPESFFKPEVLACGRSGFDSQLQQI